MNTVTALGDQWERVLIASLHEKRKGHVQQAESCKAGGDYQAQFMRIVLMYDRMIAALAQTERVALSDAELRIEHNGCQPHGIRDKRGFLLFFPAIVKYYDQEARYREEIEQQNMLANFLLKSLAAQADLIPANSLELESERDIFPSLGSTWLHTNGSTYTVMHCANRDSDRADYPPTVVYRNTHGKIFAKPLATWYRSRVLIDVPITQPLIAEATRDDDQELDLKDAVIKLYQAPFKFICGYIQDANSQTVADDYGEDAIVRLRGWGRISYMPEPEKLQDAVGEHIAAALNAYWNAAIAASKDAQ